MRSDLILYSGSLRERKGVFALARAARLFLKELPYAKLRVVGGDPNGARQRILDLAGPGAVRQVEFREAVAQPELASLMRSATVFAMPSLLESFGNVWAEAMASGVPVVGSKLSCGPEVVPDGEAGILVNPLDPLETASAVVKLMRDPSLRRTLGMRGRSIACERYSGSVLTPLTVDFYRRCIGSAPQSLSRQAGPNVSEAMDSRATRCWHI
jgi:glycogen(starch) synthase